VLTRVDLSPNGEVPAPVPVQLAGRQVLIVDDNDVNRMVLVRTLRQAGMQTHDTASGAQALAWMRTQTGSGTGCDIVLLDAQMPHMDGFALARSIREENLCGEAPLLMLSSAGMKGDAQRAKEVGFAGYLTKPVTREELLDALARLLGPSDSRPAGLVTRHLLREQQGPMRILLVEDHVVNQRLVLILLERWGHTVDIAENGQIAVDMVAASTYDVVLMDMMMPVMDGLEATRMIRLMPMERRVPIVAMTANAMQGDRERCIAAGMDDYLSKPIKADALQEMLQRFSASDPAPSNFIDSTTLDFDGVGDGTSLVDQFDYGQAMRRQDMEMVEIVADAFAAQWPRDRAKLYSNLQTSDLPAFLNTVHALKGTLGLFGARPATDLAAHMESVARQGISAGMDTDLELLCIEVEKVLLALQQVVQTH
jgi:hypothetical protein